MKTTTDKFTPGQIVTFNGDPDLRAEFQKLLSDGFTARVRISRSDFVSVRNVPLTWLAHVDPSQAIKTL